MGVTAILLLVDIAASTALGWSVDDPLSCRQRTYSSVEILLCLDLVLLGNDIGGSSAYRNSTDVTGAATLK